MSFRDISTANISAVRAKLVRPILFVRMDFSSGVKLFHTEIGPRTFTHPTHGTETYLGLGDFGGFTADIVESIGNAPQAVKIALSGINASLLSDSLDSSEYYRRDVEMLFGFDDETASFADVPVILWSGYMDKVQITLDQGKADILLTCESRATILQSNSDLRFTDEQLQGDVTGDIAGEYIYRMADIQLKIGGGDATATTYAPRYGSNR